MPPPGEVSEVAAVPPGDPGPPAVPPRDPPPPVPPAEEAAPEASWSPPPDSTTDARPRSLLPTGLVLAPGRRGAVALAGVCVVAALAAGFVLLRSRPVEVAAPAVERAGAPMGQQADAAGEVVVSVGGRVRRPGLVRLPAGSRVDDAVRAAGGATTPVGLLNLARRLVDGEQVLVGVAGAAGALGPAGGPSLVDLNSAGVEQLDGLPGIGPVLAQRIVDWRTEHGRFGSVDQLREVPGIGESKYLQVKAKVTV